METLILTAVGAGAAETHEMCDLAVNHRRRASGFTGGVDDIIARQTLNEHLGEEPWEAVCFVSTENAVVVASFTRKNGSEWDGLVGVPASEQSIALTHLSRTVRHMVTDGVMSERDFDPARLYAQPFGPDDSDILSWEEVQSLSRQLPGDKFQFKCHVRGDGMHVVGIGNRHSYYDVFAHWCHDRHGNTMLRLDAGPLAGLRKTLFTGVLTRTDWEQLAEKMAAHMATIKVGES